MKFAELHAWSRSAAEAIQLQRQLAPRVKIQSRAQADTKLIAGADVSTTFASRRFWAAVIVLGWPDLDVVEEAYAQREADFPYIPGLLSFREIPVILDAVRKLKVAPDLILCDGQGLAHPRRFGLACHLGLWLNIPSIGCAKTKLVGTYDEPGPDRGDWSALHHVDAVVGSVLRTRLRSKPIFVSPGHLIDIDGARDGALRCCRKSRFPEPIRLAHLAVNRYRIRQPQGDKSE